MCRGSSAVVKPGIFCTGLALENLGVFISPGTGLCAPPFDVDEQDKGKGIRFLLMKLLMWGVNVNDSQGNFENGA